MRKSISLILVLVIVFGAMFSTPVMAATGDVTEKGSFSDTSRPDGGTIYWELKYNVYDMEASLKIKGNGYMPNDLYDQSWHSKLPYVCFLTSVTIGEGVKSIMNDAFYGEFFLESVKLPKSLEIIGENAFAGTSITEIYIPENVKHISSTQFESSSMIYYDVSPDNPYYMSDGGVVYSKDGTELVAFPCGRYADASYKYFLPDSVTTIGRDAFYNSPMRSFIISDNVKEIKSRAFMGAKEMQYVHIGKNVQNIYDSAFLACNSLVDVFIPPTVSYLGYYAFGYDHVIYYEGIAEVFDQAGISHGQIDEHTYNYEMEAQLEELGYSLSNFVGCEKRDGFRVYAPKATIGEDYANRFGFKYVESDICSTGFTSGEETYYGVYLTWAESYGATGYVIERRNPVDVWEEIAYVEGGSNTSYLDEAPHTAISNQYRIKSVDANGKRVIGKNIVTVNFYKGPVLNSVKNILGGLEVSWSESLDAKGYNVYRKKVGEDSFSLVATVGASKKTYKDTSVKNGTEYVYTVSAFTDDRFSKYNPEGIKCVYLTAPTCTVANGAEGVVVKWSENAYADSYSIYRKTGSGASVLVGTAEAGKTSFTDKNVKSGTTYKYYVKASLNGVKSACQTKSSQSIKYLKAPLSLKVENKTNGVKVSWSKISGASGYYVYRRTPGGSFKKIATIKKGSTVSYTDKNVSNGKKYEYTVKAYSGSYTSYYKKDGILDKFMSAPKLTSVSSSKKGVTVKYKTVGGSDGYYIYRRTPNGSWANIATVKGGKKASFTDKTAKKGKTYIYTVRAYDDNFRSGYYSGLKIKDKY